MKNTRPWMVLALALLAGLAAVILAARWMQAQAGEHTELVVATRDVPSGTPLDATMLSTIRWPLGALPEGAQTVAAALEGRVLRTSVSRGEPVLAIKLAAPGAMGGLSAVIAPGKRALTVKVNEVMGVAGFALPGNWVDVMVNTYTDDARQNSASSISKIVLERILVLAVAQDASRPDNTPKVANAVTLEVSPEQAEKLDLARSVGSLSLVLRNPIDQVNAATAGADKADLLKGLGRNTAAPAAMTIAKPVKVKAQAVKSMSIEVIHGLTRSYVDI